jgi:hypothetical protein
VTDTDKGALFRQTGYVRLPCVITAIAALAVVTACSSSSSGDPAALKTSPTSAAPSTGTSSTSPAAAVTKPPVTTTSGASSAAPSATSPGAAPAPGVTAAAPLTTVAPGRPAATKATASGVYTLDSSGKVTIGVTPQDASGTQSLTISPIKNGVQRSTLHSDDTGDTVQDVLVRDAGSYLGLLKLTSPAFTKQFRPSPAVLLVPDPATIGKTYSWSVTSTDGATKATATSKLTRNETLTIGGKKVACVVVSTHLVLSGDITYDAQMTTWWAPTYRLPVKTHTVGKGTAFNTPFKTDITAVMRSVTPA